jgi:hypothetical protein
MESPENGRPDAITGAGLHKSGAAKPTNHPKPTTGGHRRRRNAPVGLYTQGLRDGFDRGALDALRLMGRRCRSLDCAAEVEKLTEYYRGATDRQAS